MPALAIVLIGAIFAGGLACMGIAARSWRRTGRRAASGGTADGRVVALVPQQREGEPAYVTVFEFVDREGHRRRVSSKLAILPAPHAIGDRVLVSYEPGDPEDAEIVSAPRSQVALALFGASLALIAALLWWGMWLGAFTFSASAG
jgi:hypothetical protein